MVLKHPKSIAKHCCYINQRHFDIFPDPDRDALILFNRSTSKFSVHSSFKHQVDEIKPGHEATIDRHTRQLTLGEGLEFQIKLLPRTPQSISYSRHRISPRLRGWRINDRAGGAIVSSQTETLKADTLSTLTSKADISAAVESGGISVATTSKADVPRTKASNSRRSSERPETKPASAKASRGPSTMIGKTAWTEVYKVTRNERIFALKVCRKPRVDQSALVWRNERDMLEQLNHVRYLTCLT